MCENDHKKRSKMWIWIAAILYGYGLINFVLYNCDYVLNIPYHYFIATCAAIVGLLMIIFWVIYNIKKSYKSTLLISLIIQLIIVVGMFLYPNYYGLLQSKNNCVYVFDEYSLEITTEYGYDIVWGDYFLYVNVVENPLFSRIVARIRLTPEEFKPNNGISLECYDENRIEIICNMLGKEKKVVIDPNQQLICY